MTRNYIFIYLLFLIPLGGMAQYKMPPEEYIELYKPLALRSMNSYRIPASITLAQGMLESGNGGSRLAVQANNHFGIKCKSSWTGQKIYHDDDAKGECFRKYRSAEDSYKDHSEFLTQSQRYASLFELKTTDYKGWAHGLKSAGYATNPRYAYILIDLIERYNLNEIDARGGKGTGSRGGTGGIFGSARGDETSQTVWFNLHPVERNNGVRVIVAVSDDSFRSIAARYGMSVKRLLKINDLPREIALTPGTAIYVEPKAKHSREFSTHTVMAGDSYHSISQKYGIRLKSLLKMNPVTRISSPRVGQTLQLR